MGCKEQERAFIDAWRKVHNEDLQDQQKEWEREKQLSLTAPKCEDCKFYKFTFSQFHECRRPRSDRSYVVAKKKYTFCSTERGRHSSACGLEGKYFAPTAWVRLKRWLATGEKWTSEPTQ